MLLHFRGCTLEKLRRTGCDGHITPLLAHNETAARKRSASHDRKTGKEKREERVSALPSCIQNASD